MIVKGDKTCKKCINERKKQSTRLVFILSSVPIPIFELVQYCSVCKEWKATIEYIVRCFKSLQYKLSYERFSRLERILLKNHFKLFSGHSRLLVQCIRGLCQIDDRILHLLDKKSERIPCKFFFCDHHLCSRTMNIYDFLELLYAFPNTELFQSNKYKTWFEERLKNLNVEWLCLLIPWIMHTPFIDTFIPSDDVNLVYKIYFECQLLKDGPSHRSNAFYVSISERLLQECEFRDDVMRSEELLKVMSHQPVEQEVVDRLLPCRLPYDPRVYIVKIDMSSITTVNSYTKPYKVSIETTVGPKTILLKFKDDLRKDRLLLTAQFILMQMNPYFEFCLYNVMPVREDYGWVEFLPNSVTLYDVLKENTLQNHLLNMYSSFTIKELRTRAVKTIASNSLFCYLFGIGDRNTHNIILSELRIVNIDYAYILGNDPKSSSLTRFNLRSDFVDLIGGRESKEFADLVVRIESLFNSVKPFAFFFYTFLKYLAVSRISPFDLASVRTHIEQRFNAFEDVEINVAIYTDSQTTYTATVADFSHRITSYLFS